MNVYIFEDEYLDRTAIEAILHEMRDMQIVGTGKLVSQAVQECVRLQPGLIIADSDIDGDKTAGPRFVKAVREKIPYVHILGLTKYQDCITPLIDAGCNFVVDKALIYSKDAALKSIQEALFSRPLVLGENSPPTLTEVQSRVLKLICAGLKESEIIEQMGFSSKKPLVNAKRQLLDIFGAANMPNLVDHAYRAGYLNPRRRED
jgi:DNA-binding NarL/FixJ family response regulator